MGASSSYAIIVSGRPERTAINVFLKGLQVFEKMLSSIGIGTIPRTWYIIRAESSLVVCLFVSQQSIVMSPFGDVSTITEDSASADIAN